MSLTTNDLQAIKGIVDDAIDRKVPGIVTRIVEPAINRAINELSRQTAAGFAEVHEKIDRMDKRLTRVEDTVDRIEVHLRAHDEQLDDHAARIGRLETTRT